jgi:hypothetical protein
MKPNSITKKSTFANSSSGNRNRNPTPVAAAELPLENSETRPTTARAAMKNRNMINSPSIAELRISNKCGELVSRPRRTLQLVLA